MANTNTNNSAATSELGGLEPLSKEPTRAIEVSESEPGPGRIFLVGDKRPKSAERGKGRQVSECNGEANRRNAQRSPGPTTARGKSYSRLNSLKHGLLARAIPLRNLPFYNPKDELEVKKLLRDLCRDWKPQGRTEELLVEEIAWNYVQLSRLCRLQTADARIAMEEEFRVPSVAVDEEFRVATVEERDMLRLARAKSSREELLQIRSLVDQTFQTSSSVGGDLMERIYSCRFDPEKCSVLQKLFMAINARTADFEVRPSKRDWEMRLEFLKTLEDAISEAVEAIDSTLMRPRQLAIARFEQHLLPNEEKFRKLLRYHPMLNRELHRCIAQLEHLQARRRANEYRDSEPGDDSLPGEGKIAA